MIKAEIHMFVIFFPLTSICLFSVNTKTGVVATATGAPARSAPGERLIIANLIAPVLVDSANKGCSKHTGRRIFSHTEIKNTPRKITQQ